LNHTFVATFISNVYINTHLLIILARFSLENRISFRRLVGELAIRVFFIKF